MSATYYRIHRGEAATLLDESTWRSRPWVDGLTRPCSACGGLGDLAVYDPAYPEVPDNLYGRDRCGTCDGRGQVQDVRRGVSACASIDDLRSYFRARLARLDGCVLVEMVADLADEEDVDAADGAVLVYPREVVSVTAIDPADFELRCAGCGARIGTYPLYHTHDCH